MNSKIVIILFISSLLNIFLLLLATLFIAKRGGFSYLKKKIATILNTKKEPGEIEYSYYYLHKKSQFEKLPSSDSDVIFLGDSLTDECEWAELLGNPNIQNRGISGDTTDMILNRLDKIVDSKPKKIFLLVGVNDFINFGKSVEKTVESYKNILIIIQNGTPNTQVFIQSILPVNNKYENRVNNKKILEYNLNLRELAKDFSFTYIDLFSRFSDVQNELDPRYTLDGIHLNGQGYLVWKEVIEKYVAPNTISL